MEISTESICPSLLRLGYFDGYKNINMKFRPRICYDYEIEYYIKSSGGVTIDGKDIFFDAGDISVRKPGQHVCGIPTYECVILCFDIAGNRYCPENYMFGTPFDSQPAYSNPLLDNLPGKLKFPNPGKLAILLKEMDSCLRENLSGNRLKINSILQYILSEIICENEKQRKLIYKSNKHIISAVEYINDNFTDDINIGEMIRKLGISKAYFNRCFKDYCGTTPGSMILAKRMEKAKMLLSIGDDSVSEISVSCGFNDPSYFARKFREHCGCSPRDYREFNQI